MEPRSDLVQIRQALLEANFLDYQDALAQAPAAPIPSNKHLRWEKRFLRNPTGFLRRQSRPPWVKVLQTAACILLALCLSFAALLTTNAQAREWVAQWILRERDNLSSYQFQGSLPANQKDFWFPATLPEGYQQTDFIEKGDLISLFYNGADPSQWIEFSYLPIAEGNGMVLDTDHHTVSSCSVQGLPGKLYTATIPDSPNMLVWLHEREGYAFLLSSPLPGKDLIQIADHVQKANP
ncbi:MAG: DUF4367 domain-containing protein [Evtepia sp.]|uniref:DUF4367 domain-containing protein n=1 Tax=Evtepia sp. TaxID=2773933 RepID=UPI002A7579D9|nr:DUF4367 domain-containing protein [Evtepia sp.]MDY3014410.1 DUF4367 domain-containing protein [Evtepia sp.]